MHFNTALTTVNIAKAEAIKLHKTNCSNTTFSFSMADAKKRAYNHLLMKEFISIFQIDPKLIDNNPKFDQIINFGTKYAFAA